MRDLKATFGRLLDADAVDVGTGVLDLLGTGYISRVPQSDETSRDGIRTAEPERRREPAEHFLSEASLPELLVLRPIRLVGVGCRYQSCFAPNSRLLGFA